MADDLLSITAIHPDREDVIEKLLRDKNADGAVLGRLINQKLISVPMGDVKRFYKRNIE